jgi:hypothetical protein
MSDVALTRDSKEWRTVVEALDEAARHLRESEEDRLGKHGSDFVGFASGGKAAQYERYVKLRDSMREEVKCADREEWLRLHPELVGIDCELCHSPISLTGCTQVDCPLRANVEASGAWLEEVKKRLSETSVEDWIVDFAFARNTLAGRRVKVRAGAEILTSTHPNFERGDTVGRVTTVTVHSVLPAHAGEYRGEHLPAEITWAGAGGYWRTVRLDDIVELLPGPA